MTRSYEMERTVIKIDEERCNGCGKCVSGCHEGALQVVNGKAVVVSDLYCDGLGACIGECPVGAITLEKRKAAPYDEAAVMERLVPKGQAVVLAHLKHLKDHGETEWLRQGLDYLKRRDLYPDLERTGLSPTESRIRAATCTCPGATAREIARPGFRLAVTPQRKSGGQLSALRQFPVQLHLLNPRAGFLKDADLLLAADCTAFACGDFHSRFLSGKTLAIACPKLDGNLPVYVEKLTEMIDIGGIGTLTVLIMEVPCCQGLVRIAMQAREHARRNIPLTITVLSVSGEVIDTKWI